MWNAMFREWTPSRYQEIGVLPEWDRSHGVLGNEGLTEVGAHDWVPTGQKLIYHSLKLGRQDEDCFLAVGQRKGAQFSPSHETSPVGSGLRTSLHLKGPVSKSRYIGVRASTHELGGKPFSPSNPLLFIHFLQPLVIFA